MCHAVPSSRALPCSPLTPIHILGIPLCAILTCLTMPSTYWAYPYVPSSRALPCHPHTGHTLMCHPHVPYHAIHILGIPLCAMLYHALHILRAMSQHSTLYFILPPMSQHAMPFLSSHILCSCSLCRTLLPTYVHIGSFVPTLTCLLFLLHAMLFLIPHRLRATSCYVSYLS